MSEFTFTIQNPVLQEFLEEVSSEEVESYIQFFYDLKTSTQLKYSPNTMEDLFEPVIDHVTTQLQAVATQSSAVTLQQFTSLSQQLEKITGIGSGSSKKGKVGEDFMEEALATHFPTDQLECVTKTGHMADFRLITTDAGCEEILIESKNMTTVKKTDMDKFLDDVERSKCRFGIFASIRSGIPHKKPFELEQHGDSYLLYISHAGFDCLGLIYGIQFIRSCLVPMLEKQENGDLEKVLKVIAPEIKKCRDTLNRLTSLTRSINSVKGSVKEMEADVKGIRKELNDHIKVLKELK